MEVFQPLDPCDHGEFFPHQCHVCWRRFKKLWILNAHLKTHSKKSRENDDQQLPVTINGMEQTEELRITTGSFEQCMTCGDFYITDAPFPIGTPEIAEGQEEQILGDPAFLAALDPVTTFQAWQIMKTGKVAEVLPAKRYLQTDAADCMPPKKKAKKKAKKSKKTTKKKAKDIK